MNASGRTRSLGLAAALVLGGAGCVDVLGARACDAMIDRGIEVQVREARTGTRAAWR